MASKLQLWNVQEGTVLECMFNPKKLPESLKAVYTKLTVPGMSHQPVNFSHVENHSWTIETLWAVQTKADVDKLQEARKFILSLMYPWRGHTSPPRALLVFGPTVSLTGFVTEFDGEHVHFDAEQNTTWWTCKLTFEEVRDARLYGDDVLRDGTRRGTGSKIA